MSYFDHEDGPVGPPPPIQLCSASLLSKWGFSDGDLVSHALSEYLTIQEIRAVDSHAVLREIVHRFLLPVLTAKVEVEHIECCHNPVRAVRINGEDATRFHYGDHDDEAPKLMPEYVIVPGEEVLAIARRIIAEKSQ